MSIDPLKHHKPVGEFFTPDQISSETKKVHEAGVQKISKKEIATPLPINVTPENEEKKLGRIERLIGRFLFPLSGRTILTEEAKAAIEMIKHPRIAAIEGRTDQGAYFQRIELPQYTALEIRVDGTRHLQAFYAVAAANRKETTVVLFHGNAMTGAEMYQLGDYYLSRGFDVLMPTMGGYPGSPGVKTCEASAYQDVFAIKQHLERLGVEKAAYHGLSIGGALALQAATTDFGEGLTTVFVVADQTFTNAEEVAVNALKNAYGQLASFAKTLIRNGIKKDSVLLPGHRITEADGLDNVAKAKKLATLGVPLIVTEAERDSIMGVTKDLEEGYFKSNLGKKLFDAYRKALPKQRRNSATPPIILASWKHCQQITCDTYRQAALLDRALEKIKT